MKPFSPHMLPNLNEQFQRFFPPVASPRHLGENRAAKLSPIGPSRCADPFGDDGLCHRGPKFGKAWTSLLSVAESLGQEYA